MLEAQESPGDCTYRGVNDSLRADISSRRRHGDPAALVLFRHSQRRGVCLQVDLARLQQDAQQGMDELVRPPVRVDQPRLATPCVGG